jgi:hypothetical protein
MRDANRKHVNERRNGAVPRRRETPALSPQEAMLYIGGAFALVITMSLAIIYGILYAANK